jgi:hypothetical protein
MARRARPFITLVIKHGSKLLEGRLPLARRKRSDGMEVDLDPVSFAALLASVGKLFSVDQVTEEIKKLGPVGQPDQVEKEGCAGKGHL